MRKIILLVAFALGLGGGYYGWSEFNRKAADPADVVAQLSVDANALLSAYEANEEAANAQYTGKSIEVTGAVREVKKNDDGTVEIILNTESDLSAISCSCSGDNAKLAETLKTGDAATVRGTCTGYLSDVVLTPCAVIKK